MHFDNPEDAIKNGEPSVEMEEDYSYEILNVTYEEIKKAGWAKYVKKKK
jgi:hypothetical protein